MIILERANNLSIKNFIPVVFPNKFSNESAIMVVLSEADVSLTVRSSVVAIVVVSGVVVSSEDAELHK